MLQKEIRENLVAVAQGFLGCKESDGSHRKIIDIYNENKPLARSYKMSYTDAWCACFVSVVAIKAGLVDIIPKEVSCNKMIELFKGIGRWEENDAYVPNTGDIIFYDWDDSGVGENKGTSEHVGIVVSVTGSTIKVIEGNMNDAVGYRNIAVNGKYIRGYGLPDYASKATAGNDEIIWAFLASKGLNDYAVAGIMGNLYAESGLKPSNLQNSYEKSLNHTDESYTKAVDSGTYSNFVKDCAGYGLAQWTYWSRKQALLDFTKASGTSIGDLTTQLNFLWKELQSYTDVMAVLKNAKSVPEASDIIITQYEAPADQSSAAQTKRAGYGQAYFDKFSGKSVDNSLNVIIGDTFTTIAAENVNGYFEATLAELAKLFPGKKFKLRDILGCAGYPSIMYEGSSKTVIAASKSV